jgi:excisionase family DNA binding protein
MNGQGDLLTPQEVAAMFRMKAERVMEWARQGLLPRVKMGKFVRFRRSDVEAFIARQAQDRERAKW